MKEIKNPLIEIGEEDLTSKTYKSKNTSPRDIDETAKQGLNVISSNISKEKIIGNSKDRRPIQKNTYELPQDDTDEKQWNHQDSMDLPKIESALKNEETLILQSDMNKMGRNHMLNTESGFLTG